MAGGYCRKRAPVSTIDKLLPVPLIKSCQTAEIMEQIKSGLDPLPAVSTLPAVEMVRSHGPADLAHGSP